MEKDFQIYQVAKMYYIEHMKQNAIAKALGISNIQVSRLLKRAEVEGIVTFNVEAPDFTDWELGSKFKAAFPSLKEALVVTVNSSADARDLVGTVAAKYVQNLLEPDSVMGISWGRILLSFVKSLDETKHNHVKVFQMSGGFWLSEDVELMPSNMIKLAGIKLNADTYIWNAPLFVASEEIRRSLMEDPSLQYVEELSKRMDISIFGISELGDKFTMKNVGVISEQDVDELQALGAVGDIMGYFIDKNGAFINWSKAERCVGTRPETAAKAKNAICLATGVEKAAVLRLAIQQKYCNTVIISSDLAQRVLQGEGGIRF